MSVYGKITPTHFPSEVGLLFEELTGPRGDMWGLRAAITIVRFRKRHDRSPTFLELFDDLLDAPRLSALERKIDWSSMSRDTARGFRHHCAIHWHRSGWIAWERTPRSLRPGPAFAVASRRWRSDRQPAA